MGFTALEGCYGTLAFSFTTLGSRKASGHGIYLFVVFVGMFPMQLLAFAFHFWIKTRKNTAVVVFSLIASGLLLTAYVASILYCVWPRITVDPLDTSIPVGLAPVVGIYRLGKEIASPYSRAARKRSGDDVSALVPWPMLGVHRDRSNKASVAARKVYFTCPLAWHLPKACS